MGPALLVFRLVVADVRRHPAQAAILLVSIIAATAALSLGRSMDGATETLYRQTRAATAGPDVVAYSPGTDRAAIGALKSLEDAPGVVAHSGPYRQYYTRLTAHGSTGAAVVQVADLTPGPVDRPLVTSGGWVRPGGVVVERGFATALGVRVGDDVTVAGRSLPIAGIAVTAASAVYPWAPGIGPGGGPSDGGGLVWMAEQDTRALASPDVPVTSLISLKLRDPDTALALTRHDPAVGPAFTDTWVSIRAWQHIAEQDSVMLRDSQPILAVGSWLLGFLAIGGVATLAAGRAAKQTRRVGVLKAAGATPGLVAAVLFAEYLSLALLADALGLIVARLIEPAVVNPSAGLLTTASGPTGDTIALTTVVVLHACNTAATLAMFTGLLVIYAQPAKGYPGSSMANDLRNAQEHHVLLGVTAALVALAAVNTVTITWTTAQEARHTMAVARTLGATPGQITAGLSTAQLLPTLPGALAGILLGLLLCLPFSQANTAWPPAWSLLTAALAALPATAALTAVPARLAARRSIARTLSPESS
ncbi:FtsX-like permease family protein [Actinomadura coerulea]|uniref:FtsX-like permease family protein n=1 Tax=Actinomadura coerulea TaxID=46159 RepID=UPI00343B4DF4